jgi:hypothetical protein
MDVKEEIVGFDHAVSGRDESIAFVCDLLPCGCVTETETRPWHNTLIHDQVNELALSHPNAHFCVDATAEGGKECLGYFQRAGLDTLGVDFGKSKVRLMVNFKNTMQTKCSTCNRPQFRFKDEKLLVQLNNYHFKESDTVKGRYKFGEPGTPDDRVDAAALACWRAAQLRGYGGESSALFVGGDDVSKPGMLFS